MGRPLPCASGRPRSSGTSLGWVLFPLRVDRYSKLCMPLIFAGLALIIRSIVLRIYRAKTGQVDPLHAAVEAHAPLEPAAAPSAWRRWSDMALLETRGLTVSYGGLHANDDIDLDVEAGTARRADRARTAPARRRSSTPSPASPTSARARSRSTATTSTA